MAEEEERKEYLVERVDLFIHPEHAEDYEKLDHTRTLRSEGTDYHYSSTHFQARYPVEIVFGSGVEEEEITGSDELDLVRQLDASGVRLSDLVCPDEDWKNEDTEQVYVYSAPTDEEWKRIQDSYITVGEEKYKNQTKMGFGEKF